MWPNNDIISTDKVNNTMELVRWLRTATKELYSHKHIKRNELFVIHYLALLVSSFPRDYRNLLKAKFHYASWFKAGRRQV